MRWILLLLSLYTLGCESSDKLSKLVQSYTAEEWGAGIQIQAE